MPDVIVHCWEFAVIHASSSSRLLPTAASCSLHYLFEYHVHQWTVSPSVT